ncbi:hypothetical protein PLCT2_01696 [Planctomycetaceae bacterium]|nr:hypothetical protein PLCT2_01696 [Planctomycetaceae bacterium]
MHLLLMLAQAAPQWTEFVEPEPQEPNWAFLVFMTIAGFAVQALFGWWAVMKAEEHDSNKIAAFFAGFVFLYAGVRMAPILRYDRIFNKPIVPRPLPPRQPPGPMPHVHGQPVIAQPPPAPVSNDACPACGTSRTPGRKFCMSCGAALPRG